MVVTKEIMLFMLLCYLLLQQAHSKCRKSYTCRNLTLEFPLASIENPECGLFLVDGCENNSIHEHPRLLLESTTAISPKPILRQRSKNKFLIVDHVLETLLKSRNSCYAFTNMSLPQIPSVSFTFSPNITFFTCYNHSRSEQIEHRFQNYSSQLCQVSTSYYKTPANHVEHALANDQDCSLTQLPIKPGDNSTDLLQLLTPTFELELDVSEACYECFHGGGQCLADNDNKFYCTTGNTRPKKILLIGGMIIASLTSTLIILYIFIRRKHAKGKQEHDRDIEIFLKNNGNLAPMRYKYSTITKMTNSFSEKLGKGGFGSVYKGKFPDGHLMAVKVLNESNGNGEDFMNDHVNIVALLGFCFEGSKRALIYDFMPYGSLEKFIDNNTGGSSSAESVLGWDKLFEIALGIARGLDYLHQGCSTRILHLDIKPQNILLDKDLNPRISDFGLAKLCPNRSSVVSMLVARGTIGYIAPEVFSRNFGEVSYKSDVYSYGMLVLEMVGGRRTVERNDVDHTSEIYFPHYIYRQLKAHAERDGDLVEILHDEDESKLVQRNLMIVGLWCIQTNPKDRPTMTKVVEMLEGKLGSLEIPPKPYLYSPPRSAPSFLASESF